MNYYEIKQKIRAAIQVAADTPEQIRPCDAWRVYEEAQEMGVLQDVKTLVSYHNERAYAEMIEYEKEMEEA